MAIVGQRLRMFEEVRDWLETLVESDDLLGLGKIPYPVLQVGMCLGLEYRDVYEIDHNYREHYEKTLHLLQLWRHKGGQHRATWWNLVCCLERLQDAQILEDVKTVIQEKYARAFCSGMDIYMKYTDELYSVDRKPKQDSGIIIDLSNTTEDTFYDPSTDHKHANVFPAYQEELPSPPSCLASPQDFNSSTDPSFFSFSSTNLTSLATSTDQSDSSSSHHHRICSSSDQYLSTESGRECFFTPHTSMETPEHSDISESTTRKESELMTACGPYATACGLHTAVDNRESDKACRTELAFHQEEQRLKKEELLKFKELHHKEKQRVHALKKKLVDAQDCMFREKRMKEQMQSKVAECEQRLDYLLDHLRICDEKYSEMHHEREELKSQLHELKACHRVDLGVQAELAMLEEEKSGLLEQVEDLGAKYLKAQSDIHSLQLKCLCVVREKEREAAVMQQCRCEKQWLQSCVEDLNAELQSCRRLKCFKCCLTVAHPYRCTKVEHEDSECYYPAPQRKRRGQNLYHRRCLSDSCLESGDDGRSILDVHPESPC